MNSYLLHSINSVPFDLVLFILAVDVCTLAKDEGDCLSLVPSWYFDDSNGKCTQFFYTGCGGNGNRFSTQQQCTDRCSHRAQISLKGTTVDIMLSFPFLCCFRLGCINVVLAYIHVVAYLRCVEVCSMPVDSGSCSASHRRWVFDVETRECQEFIYGGCSGNRNRFNSQEDCLKSCLPAFPTTFHTGKFCQ